MNIALWWNIPCKSIVPVARELAALDNRVYFLSQSALSEERKRLGWKVPDFGKAHYYVLADKNWQSEVDKYLQLDFDIHIFNGVYLFPKLRYALDKARKSDIQFGVISEAYHNPYSGVTRLLKTVFTRTVTPFRVFPRVGKARFILSSSGRNFTPFGHLGWKQRQFFPFGYFPENECVSAGTKSPSAVPQILCTGYINRNKGQHLLVEALAILKEKGEKFHCTITGFGAEEQAVKRLVKMRKVNDCISLPGVVSDHEMKILQSQSDIFVAPGLEEPWGIRVNEALLSHTPVVVSNKVGASDLVAISGAGVLFESGNVTSLVTALGHLLVPENLCLYQQKAKMFAAKITPASAAEYLNDVIEYTLSRKKDRPVPSWLQRT